MPRLITESTEQIPLLISSANRKQMGANAERFQNASSLNETLMNRLEKLPILRISSVQTLRNP